MHRHLSSSFRHIRTEESAMVRKLLEQRHSVAIVGRHGMGKTVMLSRLAAEFRGSVLHIPCNSAECDVSLSGLALTVAALRGAGSAEADALLESALAPDLPYVVAADRLVAGIYAVSAPRGMLIVIDGVDQMDAASLEITGHLLRRLSGTEVQAVIAARRIGDEGPLSGIPVVELTALDRAASIDLAHEISPEPLCADAALTAAATASGNPLALRHVLEMMTPRQKCGDAPFARPLRTSGVADSFCREILGETSDATREVLRTLALAPLTEPAQLLSLDPGFFDELDELQSLGVVERDGPYLRIPDALVRSSLYWGLPANRRAALRERTEASRCGELMTIWHRSFTRVDDDTASQLLRGARRLLRGGFPEAAVEFAERALLLAHDDAGEAELLLDLAECFFMNADSVFAERYARFARTSSSIAVQLRALRVTIQTEYYRNQSVPAVGTELWTPAEMAKAPNEAAGVQVILALCRIERAELSEAASLLDSASELAELAERESGLADATSTMLDCARALHDAYRGSDRRALECFRDLSGEAGAVLSPISAFAAVVIGRALTLTEHYGKARSVFELLEHRLPETSVWRRQLPLARADLAIRGGELELYGKLVKQARERQQRDLPLREDLLILLECRLLYQQGMPGEAEELEERLMHLASSVRHRNALAQLNAVQGQFLLESGLPTEALRHLQRCDELLSPGLAPAYLRHEPILIEALLQVGRREHAELVFRRFGARLDRFPSRWGEIAAQRCEALLERGEKSIELFRRSLRSLKPEDSDHEKAITLAAYAACLQELGAGAEAQEQRSAAAALFRSVGDGLRASRLADMHETAPREGVEGGRHPLLSQLSEEERTVVRLVQEGRRNREIADSVFVSLRTVEIRLTSVYRRFGVRSRTELLAKLAQAPTSLSG